MRGLELSPPVFAILSALIEERTGLHYELEDRELLADKLAARAGERGVDSLLDYYYFLRYDPAAAGELALLVEALVVNETYFFREQAALGLVAGRLVPELIARGVRPRIWCAGCATGEEPLTLAMLLDAEGQLEQVELVASDISARALEHAKRRKYFRRSLRALPPGVVGRWFEPCADGLQVVPRIADAVSWRRVNLTASEELAPLGVFDIVLCRNVLIYFSDSTTERVIAALAGALRENGCLIVGASESLLRFDSCFVCEERAGSFIYRKAKA